jgi:hypothetical protein
MQKQLSRRSTWLLKTAYWLGYGSVVGIFALLYLRFQSRIQEDFQWAVLMGLYNLCGSLGHVMGKKFAQATGHSQARQCRETWTRTPGPLPQFPLLVVWSDKPYRDTQKRRFLGLSVVGAGLYLLYYFLFQRREFIHSLGILILPLIIGLDCWYAHRRAPYQMVTASREGVRESETVPWDELSRVEVRREYDYLGAPSLLALNLFDAAGKDRGQVRLEAEYFSRPESISLERFYEALRAAFERHENQGT